MRALALAEIATLILTPVLAEWSECPPERMVVEHQDGRVARVVP